jgi:hypothetical protein
VEASSASLRGSISLTERSPGQPSPPLLATLNGG